ncbi:DUF5666 domain-containing protein [Amycolatopsis sp. NPDC059027]|uniref:DUF5666 domain-containing protein n=1 Tax=unclassified Amycolatopsis TaxID=2618356 RepID=UPI003671B9F5
MSSTTSDRPAEEPTAELPPVSPESVVAAPAVEGDLDRELKRVATPFGKPTLILAALLVFALAFGAGAWTHAAFRPGSSAASGSGSDARGQGQRQGQNGTGGQGTGNQGGTRGAGGRGTAGTIEKIEGSTLTLKTAQGTEITVSTTDSTTIGLTQPGKLADLKPGATVTVQGQPDSSGAVTAQAITQQPPR